MWPRRCSTGCGVDFSAVDFPRERVVCWQMDQGQPVKILIVEDQSNWLVKHERQLREKGIDDITTANSVEQAIRLIQENDFTAVLADGLDGLYFKIVEAAQVKQGTRVIVISAREPKEEAQFGQEVSSAGGEFINKDKFGNPGYETEYKNLAESLKGQAGRSKEAPVF
ncbi:hypothetical protein COX59_00455 [Candidatus Beckwithbacteria bacterium CG_4_10_14_0_2_um_filter_47_25]|uniref:Response regulatory domain-containing protein n=1 Tax=Candidatus Beckwithbacteria bacterium CG_4_10_14_0_2_um_filter_47_25 TaxID=1974493 RepID=A0A2M7W7C2_9BACT|nr:MAG: hypothetical protein COX59_00455 [Candidatus Beckwithbacteria bacterium CG_4_10_14_0_2_um_filter_47_25]